MDQKTTDALISLRRIQRRIELYARSLAQATGLSGSQLKVLQLLSGPGKATPGDLVRMTALSNASVTSLASTCCAAPRTRFRTILSCSLPICPSGNAQ